MSQSHGQLDSVMHESRLFPPPAEFATKSQIGTLEQYQELWNRAAADLPGFWAELAREELHWFEPFTEALRWNEPVAEWFVGGKTNASYNCLDAHLDAGRGERTAIIWEGEPGDTRTLTYAELHRQVCKFANVLKGLGVQQGDRVSIYMPMTPELAIAMLACARIGAVHSVIFAGFSAEAIADRNNDAEAVMVITADAAWRRGRALPLKQTVDDALKKSPTVKHCIVLDRVNEAVHWEPGRDHWWHDLMREASEDCPATPLDSEAPLFILYTSGSTGKPKGIKHTTAGYNLFVKKTFQWVFDHRDEDVFWCTADCGWVTGHSYVVYGPLSAGAAVLMYEGAPNHPAQNRFWEIIERHKVSVFYTAPTAIRAFIKWGEDLPKMHDLSSLRLLGTVGEGINPEAWMWYHRVIGGERCPIVDTWWQTETGGIMMSPLPGAIATKPGSCCVPLPGVVPKIISSGADLVADDPKQQAGDKTEVPGGWLTITQPWPGMLRGIWGDDERYREVYWTKAPGRYLAGDNARRDADGYYWIMGRIDDVLNVSGHRLSTIEIESALVSHPAVAEAAAVGRPDELKGEAVAVFVTLRNSAPSDELRQELKQHVRTQIGALAQPDDIRFTNSLPKTRSGKIMRRLLKDIAAGKESVGDTSTLEDYTVLATLRSDEE
ncbi:Acetyl-coenzyme A ligase [Pirellulimonas nuda]|uniref:Acetyl-coenzyme A synthetase n=1 Tax=Pirellulimonas nuda TaxID=2528009 RepID=A0A518DI46_9BACT|nr:acetate--CoA ligase [Pirellulimonas nuda]QDU91158.1 Acetyl-coenzyme A ligase [Pirellulimonas nuda]